jgi:hypothetical protein
MHNEEVHSCKYARRIKSSRMRWAGHMARMGNKRNAYRILVGNPEGEKALGRPKLTWARCIEIGWSGMDCIDLAQDKDQSRAVVNAVTNLRVP